jgi:protein SCO1/2
VRAFAKMLAVALLITLLGNPREALAGGDLSELAFRPHPGAHLPLALDFVDEQGRTVPLGHFFTGKPVVLVLEYLRCTSLCGLTLERLAAALDTLPLRAGSDFAVVAISIDPRDTPAEAAAAKAKYVSAYHHSGGAGGWHFLTGPEPALRQIADTVGFRYRYEPLLDQYIHPAGFVVVSPDGIISRYMLGLGTEASDLQAGIADAAQGRTVGLFTRLLLLCHGDTPQIGRYSLIIEAAFIIANLAALTGCIVVFVLISRRRHG